MLKLESKEGQAVLIGGNVRVLVKKARNGKVQLLYDAPATISIVREQLLHKPGKESQTCEASPPPPPVPLTQAQRILSKLASRKSRTSSRRSRGDAA